VMNSSSFVDRKNNMQTLEQGEDNSASRN
jgi:hypothetical protein